MISKTISSRLLRGKLKLTINVLTGLLAASFSFPALAGVFTVTPVRIYMTSKDRAAAVTIVNDGDDEIVMQADIFEWKQKPDGEDELTLSEDMFLSPPIIKMAPKSRQVVRLAILRAPAQDRQLTYRMIVREIPEAVSKKQNASLQVALAFSMPVFITPQGSKAQLSCKLDRVAADTVKATCQNTGVAYSHPTSFLLTADTGAKIADQDTGAYILPGITRSFVLKRTEGKIVSGKAKLMVTLDDGSSEVYDVGIAD